MFYHGFVLVITAQVNYVGLPSNCVLLVVYCTAETVENTSETGEGMLNVIS